MIVIKDLCFSYNKVQPFILNGINLCVNNGDYISILGENGSGKSTLIKLLLNILKPCKGSISIDTKSLGYIPQRFENFNSQFPMTVGEMMSCHMKVSKLKSSLLIDESLKLVNMLSFKNSLIGNLSGGQQQRIFIGRALMGNPQLLVLDEPSTGIDIQSQKDVYNLIKSLNKDFGITVISVEHNLNAAFNNSKHIFKLDKGIGTFYSIEQYKKHNGEDFTYAAI